MNAGEPLLGGALDHENYDALTQEPDNYVVSEKSEFNFIVKSSVPLVVTFVLQYSLSVASIMAAGRLGPTELAAASLAVCTFNITGLAVYQGMSTSLDSLCSQAYGSGKLHNVGLYFQRCSAMIMVVTVFPLSFIWWFSGSLLLYIVADAELVELTQLWMRVAMAGAPGLLLFETGKRFLQAQHIFNAGTGVLLIAAPFNAFLHWLLVWRLEWGFVGAPIAISITYWTISLLMLCYVLFIDGKKCWNGLEYHKVFVNWMPMLKLAIPGVIMVEAEYLAFEVLTILAATFGTEALAAQSIASNVASLTFQLPFAVAVAFSTRIGHFVGMKNIHAARLVTRLSLLFALIIALINFSVIFVGRHTFATFFTSSPEVLKISNVILTLAAINQLADAFNVIAAGVLRGQGRQRIGSLLNIVSYYIIALPLGYVLAFPVAFELNGLWFGLISGVFFLAVTGWAAISVSHWPTIIVEADARHDH